MILGHLTSTYLLSDLIKRAGYKLHPPALLLGAILPDLIDKPIAFFLSYPGRGGAHSAIVLTTLFFLLFSLVGQERARIVVATVYAGCLLHLLQDFASPDVILWPFLASWDSSPSLSFVEKLNLFYIERSIPAQWWVEVLSLIYVLYSLLRRVTLFVVNRGRATGKDSPLSVET